MAKKDKQKPSDYVEEYSDDYDDIETFIDSDLPIQRSYSDFDNIGEDLPTSDNLRWELDEKEDLHQYLRDLRGEIKDKDGNWYRPKGAKRYINDEGTAAVMRVLRQALSKSVAFGNIDRNEAHVYTKSLINSFIEELVQCHKDWNFNVLKNGSELIAIMDHRIYFHLTKPIGDKTRGHRSGQMKVKISDNLDVSNEHGAGFMNKYNQKDDEVLRL